MRTRKTVIIAAAVVVTLTLLVLALIPAPIPVSVADVQRGYFADYVEDEGRTRLRDPYLVTAPITGYLRRVQLEPGDLIGGGQTLFELEPLPAPALDARSREQAREAVAAARARIQAAEAELETRQSDLALAEAELERAERLHERNLLAAEERDRRRAARDAARAAVRASRHRVDVARFELESARVVLEVADGERTPDQPTLAVQAPIGGTITRRFRWTEGPVSAGEPVLELGDLAELEVQVDLLSMDALRVAQGMRVILERWGGDEQLEGRVRRVEPAGFQRISALGVEEQRVPVMVELVTPREQWAALGDGYRVEARFVLWEGFDVLQIPTSAMFRHEGRWTVFVISNGRAERRAVSTARRSGLWTQVTDGLAPGETIITHPSDRIAHGSRVRGD
ncbi:MAG: efflux RND transporter periplasmic adaptor subunit [Pseudomonadales bacterium]